MSTSKPKTLDDLSFVDKSKHLAPYWQPKLRRARLKGIAGNFAYEGALMSNVQRDIGWLTGAEAAKEFIDYARRSSKDDPSSMALALIASSMLGPLADISPSREGEMNGFFCEIEDFVRRAMRRSTKRRPIGKKKAAKRSSAKAA